MQPKTVFVVLFGLLCSRPIHFGTVGRSFVPDWPETIFDSCDDSGNLWPKSRNPYRPIDAAGRFFFHKVRRIWQNEIFWKSKMSHEQDLDVYNTLPDRSLHSIEIYWLITPTRIFDRCPSFPPVFPVPSSLPFLGLHQSSPDRTGFWHTLFST